MKFRDQRKTNKRLLTNMNKTSTSEKSNASFGWLSLLTILCDAAASGRQKDSLDLTKIFEQFT